MTDEHPPQAPVTVTYESPDGGEFIRGSDLTFEKGLGFVTLTPWGAREDTLLIDRSRVIDIQANADEFDPDNHGVTDAPGLAPESAITRDSDDGPPECPECDGGRLYDDLGGEQVCPKCGYVDGDGNG